MSMLYPASSTMVFPLFFISYYVMYQLYSVLRITLAGIHICRGQEAKVQETSW